MDVNLGGDPDESLIDVQVTILDTGVKVGGGNCIVVPGIPVGC